mmetsp:Transcript_10472/g.21794  ORF Transcript_10472/g.21794 Transcript_10472/m.21794 type:complete len:157 (-) Transcript_10472:292-762(-)|eukprot:CAMPEP_0118943974 /NCGR_PEP_ID=MMETSP1169-20130426/39376_1 /TAXON_ID=36882 /ORGANISM="Pyramimonas obovata, Strain CCMP722" /LENGTH=156 /DNA_ID=CAMNT_0006889347 /DNA_START=287 /DNA_END=757 /DNA_ORIENTATION=+
MSKLTEVLGENKNSDQYKGFIAGHFDETRWEQIEQELDSEITREVAKWRQNRAAPSKGKEEEVVNDEDRDEDMERLRRLDGSDDEEEEQEGSIEHMQKLTQRALVDLEEAKRQAKERMTTAKAAAFASANKDRKAIRYYAHPASVALTMDELEQKP